MQALSEVEIEENVLNLDTVQQWEMSNDDAEQLLSLIMNSFKFGYGGYNGYFKNREELMQSIREAIKKN